jgi:crossover junction endodeoxyribonuclease RuvC
MIGIGGRMSKRKTSTEGSRIQPLTDPLRSCYLGIDPGMSGGIALMRSDDQQAPLLIAMPETLADIREAFELVAPITRFALIENVHSFPGQGVASTFKFGRIFGRLEGMLTAFNIPYDYVTPQKWQGVLGCLSKGNKNITKIKAQTLFPGLKITHKTADALLIASYCRYIKMAVKPYDSWDEI